MDLLWSAWNRSEEIAFNKVNKEHHLRVFEGASFQGSSSGAEFKVGTKMEDNDQVIMLFLLLGRLVLHSSEA